MRRLATTLAAFLVAAGVAAPAGASQAGAALRAGVGKADITPRTGYYLGGWTRADRVAQGQHTRLFARALVLEQGGRKVALVAVDHRIAITANRYRLTSTPFRVVPARSLQMRRVEGGVTLDYPPAVRDQDLRHRPASASGGTVRYRDGSRTVTLRRRRGTMFPVPANARVLSARDRFGNRALTSSAP